MTNNFNAEQARKNAKDVKIDQALNRTGFVGESIF